MELRLEGSFRNPRGHRGDRDSCESRLACRVCACRALYSSMALHFCEFFRLAAALAWASAVAFFRRACFSRCSASRSWKVYVSYARNATIRSTKNPQTRLHEQILRRLLPRRSLSPVYSVGATPANTRRVISERTHWMLPQCTSAVPSSASWLRDPSFVSSSATPAA